MLPATVNAIKGLIAMDVSMTPVAQRDFMGMVRDYQRGGKANGTEGGAPIGSPGRRLSFKEAAERLKVGAARVRQLCKAGRLAGVSLTGVRYSGVTEESVNALLQGGKAG